MSRSSRRQRFASALLAGFLGGLWTLAAADPAAQPGSFTETIDVRLVVVDVFVTDRRGRPVLDLEAGDFALFDDGREVALSHFRAPVSPPQPPPRGSDLRERDGAAPPSADRSPLAVFVYVDNASLLAARRDRVIAELGRLLSASDIGPMNFSVVTWDGSRLMQRGGLSTDLDGVEKALGTVGGEAAAGVEAMTDFRRTLAAIGSLFASFAQTDCDPCRCGWQGAAGLWESYARRAVVRVGSTIAGLDRLVAAVAGLPGRKAVLYLSSGLARRPGLSLATHLVDLCPGDGRMLDFQTDLQRRYDQSERLSELTARANAARVTLYPLQAASIGGDSGLTRSAAIERRANVGEGLEQLADETGGDSLAIADRLFDRLRSDLRSGYELAFDPQRAADGRTHRIRVELRAERPGLELRYRRSYRDRPLEQRLVDRAEAVLAYGVESVAGVNPLAVQAEVLLGERLEGDVRAAELRVSFPVDRFTRLAAGDVPARARILVLVRPADGSMTPVRQSVVDLPAASVGLHTIALRLSLAPGENRIVVGVRDEIGAVVSFVRVVANA